MNLVFDLEKADDDDERQLLHSLNQTIKSFRKLEILSNHNVTYRGIERLVKNGEIDYGDMIWGSYKARTFFSINRYADEGLLVKAIWTKPEYRHRSNVKDLLELLKTFAVKESLSLVAVANPFEAQEWDYLLNNLEGFKYTGSMDQQDKMAKLLLNAGFKEHDVVEFHCHEYGQFLNRVKNDYHGLVPRYFVFCEE